MDVAAVLTDSFSRIGEEVHAAVDGLSAEQLAFRADPQANSIGWLVWHLSRVQDDHVAGVAGTDQVWTQQGWAERFGLPFPVHAIGYGHSSDDVAAVRVESPELLTGYYDAVAAQTLDYVGRLTDADL
ncbi:MAG TPA: DinB family protein, partial [Pseudonocardia sp.]|nr:DinB family protein [Pseudonocardia sp.]